MKKSPTVTHHLNLPNIDIEERFLNYFETCPEFQAKKYIATKDPRKKALKFFRAQHKTYLNRVYLLLDELYDPKYEFEEELHSMNRTIKETTSPHKTHEQKHCKVQESWMSPQYRIPLIKFMEDSNLIRVHHSYSPESSNAAGTYCKKYCIHYELYQDSVKWKSTPIEIDKALDQRYKDRHAKSEAGKYNSLPKVYKDLIRSLKDWELDIDSIPISIRDELKEDIEKFQKNYKSKTSHGGRFFSPITNLNKRLRKYLRYVPNPDLKFKLIDISNCTYWGLSVLMAKQREGEWLSKKDLDKISFFISIIESHKKKLIKIFSDYIKSDDYDYRKMLLDIFSLDNEFNDLEDAKQCFTEMKLLYQSEDIPNDAITFILISCLGIIYDVFADNLGVSRDTVKKKLTCVVNRPNLLLKRSEDKYKLFIEDKFPHVYELILEVSNINPKNFSYRMNSYESKLMIEEYGNKLLKDKTPFLTIHDGMIVPATEAWDHMFLINDASIKLFGLPVPIKEETL